MIDRYSRSHSSAKDPNGDWCRWAQAERVLEERDGAVKALNTLAGLIVQMVDTAGNMVDGPLPIMGDLKRAYDFSKAVVADPSEEDIFRMRVELCYWQVEESLRQGMYEMCLTKATCDRHHEIIDDVFLNRTFLHT
jgi:hypothetical protein